MENNHSSDIYDMKYAIWRIYIALGKQLLTKNVFWGIFYNMMIKIWQIN